MAFVPQIPPLSHPQIGFVCASQQAQKVITLLIFGRHHCHSLFSPHFPTHSLKQDSEACRAEEAMSRPYK